MTSSILNPSVLSLPVALMLGSALSLLSHSAKAEIQGPACRGTLLQLTLRESGASQTESFRFNLRLEAEASTSAAALDQLRARQDRLREQLEPLVQGLLVMSLSVAFDQQASFVHLASFVPPSSALFVDYTSFVLPSFVPELRYPAA